MVDFLKKIPAKPGVYIFKNKDNNVLYVGKAINLKKRVNNYFKKNIQEERINNLLKNTKKIDFILVNSEIEALLLEAKLIKEYQPPFNVRLKDDKRYLYAGISKEKFPRVFLLRAPEKTSSLLYWFGPFPSAQSIKEILRLLRRIFPFRSCQRLPKKACLYFHLNLCPGVCEEKISPSQYQKTIKKIKFFLEGNIAGLLEKLNLEMKQLAAKCQFEEAEIKKRQILMIKNLLGKFRQFPEEEKTKRQLEWLRKILIKYQKIDPLVIHRLEAYDVANLGKDVVVGAMAVFVQGEPETSSYRQFKIKTKSGGDAGALKEILRRRLKHQEWLYPQVILVDGGKAQVSSVFQVLAENQLEKQIALIGLAKKEEKLVIPQAAKGKIFRWQSLKEEKNKEGLSLLQYARDEAHRFAQRYYKKLHQKITFSSGQE